MIRKSRSWLFRFASRRGADGWHLLAIILGFGAIVAFLGTLPLAGSATLSVRGALWTVLLAFAILAWAFAVAHGRETPPASAAPDTAVAQPPPADDMELRRSRDAAEAANAAKTRYLVGVSHEIRSPLNAIYGYAQLLERGGTVTATEAGGAIRRSAEHLTNLVEGLLEISRIESGVLKLRSDIVQLPNLIDHVLGMFRMQAEAKGLTLRYEPSGRLPSHIRTDEKRLRQILINLLSNAIKYTEKGGVTLAISYRSQVATIDISDTGIGIAPQDLERIFEPFERGSSPEAALQPGIGLGLSITRVLAQILGGDIAATSTLGESSCFRLRMFLPETLDAPAKASAYGRITGYAGARRSVLVVDDDPAQATILANLLRPLGFTVFAANNGTEGLALAVKCRPDLVLLDVQMPGLGGWDVARQLRAAADAPRIIMVSANAHEFGGSGEAANHDAFVPKPVDLDSLLAQVGRQLRLSWEFAGEAAAPPPPPSSAPLPAEAQPWAERIRDLARVGHIRGVESALVELEASVPDSAPAVLAMREHVRNFDLRSLVKMLDARHKL